VSIKTASSRDHLYISKKAFVTPSILYELSLVSKLSARPEQKSPIPILRAPLNIGLREYSKGFYRNLVGRTIDHPRLGAVKFTWRGWRHLTDQKRKLRQVHDSLQLLNACQYALQNPGKMRGVRRLLHKKRGAWITEVRLIAHQCNSVSFDDGTKKNLRVVFRESVGYPVNWQSDVLLHHHIHRKLTFESIYVKEWP
jgi:hypothetical protein